MRIPIGLFYVVVSVLVHALGARWLLRHFPSLRTRGRTALVYAGAALLALAPGGAKLLSHVSSSRWLMRVLAVSVLEMFAMALTVMLVAIAGGVVRAARRAKAAPAPVEPEPAPVEPEPAPASEPAPVAPRLDRREALGRLAGVGVYGVTVSAFGWGMVRGRFDFQLEEVVVRIPGLPRALDGYVIAQVSDIHVGAFIGEHELRRGFELVRRAKPDLVVATGDLVDIHADDADLLAVALAEAGARDGAYAIVGNHDHYAGPAEVVSLLRRGGVRVLTDEGVIVRPGDGGGFALLGVDDVIGRRRPLPGFSGPDFARAASMVPPDRPKILLAHQPVYFKEVAGQVALQLSGHTHGGQIRPLTSPVTAFWDFVRGRYERNGSTLWVNRGFGTSGPPSRVGSPPEITRIVLVSA